jgi:signal transduction histidine kinase
MARLRLRTQLLVATLLIICTLTGSVLLIVRQAVRSEIARQVQQSTESSLKAFENVQRTREMQLSGTTAILAELPTLKALMTTEHALTIQDASDPFWRLAGSDLFLLADAQGRILGFHVAKPGWAAETAKTDLIRSLKNREDAAWWYANGQLYWVFLRPILAGTEQEERQLGTLAVGYQVDSSVAEQLSLVSGSQIALVSQNHLIASTLANPEQAELRRQIAMQSSVPENSPREILLGRNRYEMASALVYSELPTQVRCYILLSLQPSTGFLDRLNRTIFILAFSALVLAALLLTFVSHTITRPLDNLVAGVRALAIGDYGYLIKPRGSSEVAELGEAFSKMRGELQASQERKLATERVAALGRTASSVSHDLRHYLATVVANAEFLYEADKLKIDRHEVYEEIRTASNQMLDLLDNLRELARENSSISAVPARLDQTLRRAAEAVLANPGLRSRKISINARGETSGVFDPRKLERAFFNLLLNACEAAPPGRGQVEVEISSTSDRFEIRVADNGSGIPDSIQETLFDPFVSSGKPNGTGLGLAIVNKIVHDHNGSIAVESTSCAGTTFLLKIPRVASTETVLGPEARTAS